MNAFRISAVLLAAALTAPAAAVAQGAVQTLTLESDVDPAAAGALDPTAAGLPATLWRGSDRVEAARLVAETPARIASPTLRDLARRTLAVAAVPPRGATVVPGFAETRAAALLRMGDASLAAALLGAVPKTKRDEATDLLLMDASLLTQDRSGACAVARDRSGRAQSIVFAQTAAFCEALAGDRARAEFQAALIAERAPDATAYFQLLDLVTGAATQPGRAVKRMTSATPLDLAMFRAVGLPPPGVPADGDGPFALAVEKMTAVDPAVPLDVRTKAAWRTLRANAADLAATRQLILAVAAEKPKGDAGRIAGLFAAAVVAPAGPDRALALAKLLVASDELGVSAGIARLARPLLADLLPLASGPDIAGRIARGLLLADEPDAARRWLASLQAAAAVPGAADAAARLDEILALSTGVDPRPLLAPDIGLWFGAVDADAGKAALLAILRDAAGLPVPPALASIAQTWIAARPATPGLDAVVAAAEGRKTGETALRAVAFVQGAPPESAALHMAEAARALARAGLGAEARGLAVEAAIAGGL